MPWYRVTVEVDIEVELPLTEPDPPLEAAKHGWSFLVRDGMPVVLVQEVQGCGGDPLDNQKRLIDLAIEGDPQLRELAPEERPRSRNNNNEEN